MGVILILWIILKIICIAVPLLIAVAYLTYAERRVIGFMQGRIGPNRVGPFGLLQPFADLIKMLHKEIVIPEKSNRFLFIMAPMIGLVTAFAAWAVIPFNDYLILANINPGLLYVLAITSFGVYGILIAGWASNSTYALFGALRSAAQMVSYEIPMGFALLGVMMAAGSLNLHDIVMAQAGGLWHWYFLPLFPLFVVYCIAAVAETNRAPFDVAEGESEIVAGFHVEYSGVTFALFFLAEYASMILISALAALLFCGGWLSPFEHIAALDRAFAWVPGVVWLLLKMAMFLFTYLWLRATFPRYRYDQIMRLCWKVLLPVSLLWLVVVTVAIACHLPPWFG